MAFKSWTFRGNQRLVRAASNSPVLCQGESGNAVALVQAALITLHFPLKLSAKKYGAPDGIFGSETKRAVMAFQRQQNLTPDGRVGRYTISRLDSLLPAGPNSKPSKGPEPTPSAPVQPSWQAAVAAPSIPVSSDFKLGTDDPITPPDVGAGVWNARPKRVITATKYAGILGVLPLAYAVIGPNAVKHMKHYLGNSGSAYTIDLEAMVKEVPSARVRFDTEVQRIKNYVEQLPPGQFDITSTHVVNGYNRQDENLNWFLAIAGYSVWTKGRATISGTGPGHECRLELEYKFYDRYNWDGGKKVTIFGITITDKEMGEFHREGMAQEYDAIGSFRRALRWTVR